MIEEHEFFEPSEEDIDNCMVVDKDHAPSEEAMELYSVIERASEIDSAADSRSFYDKEMALLEQNNPIFFSPADCGLSLLKAGLISLPREQVRQFIRVSRRRAFSLLCAAVPADE